jgi:hypothetical protein
VFRSDSPAYEALEEITQLLGPEDNDLVVVDGPDMLAATALDHFWQLHRAIAAVESAHVGRVAVLRYPDRIDDATSRYDSFFRHEDGREHEEMEFIATRVRDEQ